MSPQKASLTVSSGVESRDDELFTAPSSDPTPDRHPSILRPGGHASPLKYPAVLRPGAARRSRTPSPNGASTCAAQTTPHHVSSTAVSYKAYSPPRPQSPSDELSAEIEGYFTPLEVPPLTLNKPSSPEPAAGPKPPLPPKTPIAEADSLEQRCASPPLPPKERILAEPERHVVSPMSELDVSTAITQEDHHSVSPTSQAETREEAAEEEEEEDSEPPPAYDESQRVNPPPEKAASPRRISDEGLAGAAAASAAQIGGAVAGVSSDEAAVGSSTDELVIDSADVPGATVEAPSANDSAGGAPAPPLPPRPDPSAKGKGKGKGKEPAMPGAFPAPPTRPVSTTDYKASGAAATSAASVGASVAGVGQSAGLRQARKALEKGIGHMIDKAKEHHRAREQHGHERKPSRKPSPEGERKREATHSGPVAEVSYGLFIQS